MIFKKLRASFAETREKLDRQKLMDERKPKPVSRTVRVWLINLDGRRRIVVRGDVWSQGVREPKSDNDPNAVALHQPRIGHVGYLAREEARVIAPEMDKKHRRYQVKIGANVELDAGEMVSMKAVLVGQ